MQEYAISFSSSQGNEKDGETLGVKKRHRFFFPSLPSLRSCSLLLVAKRNGSKEGVLQSAIPLAISIFFFFFLSPASRSRIASMWAYFE